MEMCHECGRMFEKRAPQHRYCSRACQLIEYQRERRWKYTQARRAQGLGYYERKKS